MTPASARQLDLFRATPRPKPFDAKQAALGIWRASGSVVGTLGEAFFTTRRLAVPDATTARFHASLKFGDTRAPGLVWLLSDLRTGEPTGVLRVFLAVDGSTVIARRVLGRAVGATISRAPRPP